MRPLVLLRLWVNFYGRFGEYGTEAKTEHRGSLSIKSVRYRIPADRYVKTIDSAQ